jgi:hypothetical protein
LRFVTLDHGGEYPDNMPQAIQVTDAEGRSCTYVPVQVAGEVVDSHGFNLETEDDELTPGDDNSGENVSEDGLGVRKRPRV